LLPTQSLSVFPHAPFAKWRNPISSLIIILLLIFALNLLLAATRASVLNAQYARLAALSEENGLQVDKALELIKQRANLADSLSLALAITRFSIAALILGLFLPQQSTLSNQYLFTLLLSMAVLIWLGEFFVERRVRPAPEIWALRLTPLARFISAALSPLLALPLALSRRSNGDDQQLVTITEDELKSLVDTSQREGLLEQDERKMIFSIFQFGDTLAREIMIPRIDMFTLEVNTPLDEAAEAALKSGYSRVPVYSDNIDNIIGLLYTKDMLKVWQEGSEYKSLRELLRAANFIPESKKVDELLAEMQAERIHIAIVADEYGGVAGLVTLEDIVEEIVGEIRDEYDQGEESLSQKISDDEYILHGRLDMDDFNEMMDVTLNTEEADTLGGYIYSRIGRVPRSGEILQEGEIRLTVEQINGRRIRRVRAQRIEAPEKVTKETNNDAN
jgi:CBS domain containing-hemolysin-like protein